MSAFLLLPLLITTLFAVGCGGSSGSGGPAHQETLVGTFSLTGQDQVFLIAKDGVLRPIESGTLKARLIGLQEVVVTDAAGNEFSFKVPEGGRLPLEVFTGRGPQGAAFRLRGLDDKQGLELRGTLREVVSSRSGEIAKKRCKLIDDVTLVPVVGPNGELSLLPLHREQYGQKLVWNTVERYYYEIKAVMVRDDALGTPVAHALLSTSQHVRRYLAAELKGCE